MWYAVSLMSRSLQNGVEAELWQEDIVCVDAVNEEEAKAKASELGASRSHGYRNISEDLVEWEFVALGGCCELNSVTFSEGQELFSRFLSRSEALSLLEPFDDVWLETKA